MFAEKGYYNTTTALIAEKAGISQPYIFRFYKTKEELFVAALDRAFERILQTFQNVESSSEQIVANMIKAYEELSVSHPNEIALQVIGLSVTEESIRNCSKRAYHVLETIRWKGSRKRMFRMQRGKLRLSWQEGYFATFPISWIYRRSCTAKQNKITDLFRFFI